MKTLIYHNKGKDADCICLNELIKELDSFKIEYSILNEYDLSKEFSADAIFALGGDGTLLHLNEFSNKNSIPLIGINTGKLGFLTEFEKSDISYAVKLLYNNELVPDEHICAQVSFNGKTHIALNDVFIQRIFNQDSGCMVANMELLIDGSLVYNIKGDGIIVSTPTGTTAYTFSAGGAILSSKLEAFEITSIAAHTFNQRPIVGPVTSEYVVRLKDGADVGIIIDGKYISKLTAGEFFKVKKSNRNTVFLRKKSYNFFARLNEKFENDFGKKYD